MYALLRMSKLIPIPLITLLLFWAPSALGGHECAGEVGSGSISPSQATVYGVVIYVSFPGQSSTVPSSAITQIETTFPNFISDMSYGTQTISLTREVPDAQNPTTAWVVSHQMSYYHDGSAYYYPSRYPGFFEEVIDSVYTNNSNAFNNKDFVAIIALGNAWSLYGGQAFHGTGFPGNSPYWDDDGFCVDLGNLGATSTSIAMATAHEYGHLVGLSDKSGGWGRRTGVYDLMYNQGFGNNFKVRPFCSKDLGRLGWIEQNNIQVVTSNTTAITLKDIRNTPSAGDKVLCKIPLATGDTLLVENHQDTGQDAVYNGKGLLIWHSRLNYYLDVEVAKGTPGTNPNADWLDSLAAGSSGDDSHLKESRKDDFFGWNSSFSSGETSFTPTSQPNTNTWHSRRFDNPTGSQGSRTTVSILNIQAGTGTDVKFDVKFDYTLASNETWPGNADDVRLAGDVTVPNGKTLTIQSGTTVKSATTDASSGGSDSDRCELIVHGKLVANGTSSNPITFQSVNGQTADKEWHGIVFKSDADDASSVKYANIKNAWYGVYCDNASPDIEHNTIIYSRIGVKGVSMGVGGSISYNTINNTTTAVSLENSQVPVKRNNLSANHRSGYFTGTTSVVQYDTLDSNTGEGISLFNGSDVTFGQCRIVGNTGWGMWLWNDSDPVLMYTGAHNNIRNNGGSGKAEIYCQKNCEPDLGAGAFTGDNDIYDSAGGRAIYIDTSQPYSNINAESNYWGTSQPDSTVLFYPSDAVDFRPYDTQSNFKPVLVAIEEAGERFRLGMDLEEMGNYGGAIAAYQHLLWEYPESRWVRAALGGLHRSYFALRENLEGFRGLMHQIAGQTRDAGIKAKAEELARQALVADERYAEAIAEYQAVVDERGQDALAAMVHIGEISLYYLKDIARAKAILGEAIARAPDSPAAFAAQMALDDAEAMPNLERAFPQSGSLEKVVQPESVVLGPNYPNPFNPQTTLSFALPRAMQVRLGVYNILGQEVRVLADGVQQAGTHTLRWDGKDTQGIAVGSGVYFARMDAEGTVHTRKLLLVR